MNDVDRFRQKAAYCSTLAAAAQYRDKRLRFKAEALRWSRLAGLAMIDDMGVPLVPAQHPHIEATATGFRLVEAA